MFTSHVARHPNGERRHRTTAPAPAAQHHPDRDHPGSRPSEFDSGDATGEGDGDVHERNRYPVGVDEDPHLVRERGERREPTDAAGHDTEPGIGRGREPSWRPHRSGDTRAH